jgi:hypothetical protein
MTIMVQLAVNIAVFDNCQVSLLEDLNMFFNVRQKKCKFFSFVCVHKICDF